MKRNIATVYEIRYLFLIRVLSQFSPKSSVYSRLSPCSTVRFGPHFLFFISDSLVQLDKSQIDDSLLRMGCDEPPYPTRLDSEK
jgi:hypothetical protein